MLNARKARLGIGSSTTEEAPWSPQGLVASNAGSPPSSRPTSPAIRAAPSARSPCRDGARPATSGCPAAIAARGGKPNRPAADNQNRNLDHAHSAGCLGRRERSPREERVQFGSGKRGVDVAEGAVLAHFLCR